eukprot:GEMP01008323.1.p1 GENE.GEMP01008323.1~~GEMP01008323.1.p1  ORF type:complete len:998 (+),score=335.26 GEMP01008323.1:413-3406(+)
MTVDCIVCSDGGEATKITLPACAHLSDVKVHVAAHYELFGPHITLRTASSTTFTDAMLAQPVPEHEPLRVDVCKPDGFPGKTTYAEWQEIVYFHCFLADDEPGLVRAVTIMKNNRNDIRTTDILGSTLYSALTRATTVDDQLREGVVLIFRVAKDLEIDPPITRFADPSTGNTTLHAVCAKGFHVLCAQLLMSLSDPNAVTRSAGHTPLTTAIMHGHTKTVETLIHLGVDLNPIYCFPLQVPLVVACQHDAEDIVAALDGNTPLAALVRKNNVAMASLLLTMGAQVATDPCVLIDATMHNDDGDLVELLLSAKADVNVRDTRGGCPILYAARDNYVAAMRHLVEHEHLEVDATYAGGQTALLFAAHHGHMEIVTLLLDTCAAVNVADGAGYTPLVAAIQQGHADIVAYLLKSSADVLMGSPAPLLAAIDHATAEVCIALIEAKADATSVSPRSGASPIFHAVDADNARVASALIQARAQVNERLHSKHTPLFYAVVRGNMTMCDVLVAFAANVCATDLDGCTPLFFACRDGNEEITACMLTAKADANVPNTKKGRQEFPLIVAARHGHSGVCAQLLQAQAAINAQDATGRTALAHAASEGHANVLNVLAQQIGCNIEDAGTDGNSLLLDSALRGDAATAKVLIARGANLNAATTDGGHTVLHVACATGNAALVEQLLERRVECTLRNARGATALLVASALGYVHVVKVLLAQGDLTPADINSVDNLGNTALCCAIARNYEEPVEHQEVDYRAVIRALCDAKADASMRGGHGNTPLMLATRGMDVSTMEVLLTNGRAAVDVPCSDDREASTALGVAARTGNVKVVRVLIQARADANARDGKRGGTALFHACETGNVEVVRLLVEEGGARAGVRDSHGISPQMIAEVQGNEMIKAIVARAVEVEGGKEELAMGENVGGATTEAGLDGNEKEKGAERRGGADVAGEAKGAAEADLAAVAIAAEEKEEKGKEEAERKSEIEEVAGEKKKRNIYKEQTEQPE